MQFRRWAGRLPAIAIAGLAVAALAVFASQPSGDSFAAQELPPAGIHQPCDAATGGDTRFCPQVSAALADPSPGANSNMTTNLLIPAPNYNFSAVVIFIPEGFDVTPGNQVSIGAVVGSLSSNATLGLLNGACNTALPVSFTMLNATTDTAQQVEFDDQFAVQNGLPRGVTEYPDYLARIFGVAPLARNYGQTNVAGVDVSLNFVIFSPIEGVGYPSVAVLLNAGDPAAEPADSPITDFCTPLSIENTSFGVSENNPNTTADEAGEVLLTNPDSDDAFVITTLAASQWDTNRNGIENALDPCKHRPWNPADFNWDPRANSDLPPPEACGETSWPGTGTDVDGDGFSNRGDNCPWIANPTQVSSNGDGIGDACYEADGQNPNASPVDLGGVSFQGCVYTAINVGAGGSPQNPPCPDLATLLEQAAAPPPAVATPTPAPTDPDATPAPGATPTPAPPGTVAPGVGAGPVSGVGALAPVAGAVPAWAAALSALGASGLLSALGYFGFRFWRRRDE